MTEDEMVGWHHWLNGHEFEQALGIGDRQGSLACLQSMGSQRVRHDWAIELYWTDKKLPVIKVVESSDFTNERGNSCLCPYGKLISFEPHLEAHNDLPLSSVLRQISYFLLHILWSLLSWNEWTFFFFSLWPFYTQLFYTFAPCLTNPAWDYADPYCSSNSNLLESCLKLA